MVAENFYQYEELAVSYALDPNKLLSLRKKIENSRMSCPLFDTERWVRNLEKGLNQAWQLYQQHGVFDHINVTE